MNERDAVQMILDVALALLGTYFVLACLASLVSLGIAFLEMWRNFQRRRRMRVMYTDLHERLTSNRSRLRREARLYP
ncbi:MAG TPA: hypothetical protein VJV74_05425 [Terriglobia bacterium]|nr:hypothetical protein [Terriglobia bacterium]